VGEGVIFWVLNGELKGKPRQARQSCVSKVERQERHLRQTTRTNVLYPETDPVVQCQRKWTMFATSLCRYFDCQKLCWFQYFNKQSV